MNKKPLIGFIGQGWIGKNYADNFEKRGFSTVRYALEKPYRANKEKIKLCDFVFIAVPTPTTPKGFDGSIVLSSLSLVGDGKIAVFKSTILPGTTERYQKSHPRITVLYSPEFLSETTAAHDVENPFSNIVGVSNDDKEHRRAAERLLEILPKAPFAKICSSTEAEIIKYTHNASGYVQIILFNLMHDLSSTLGADWKQIEAGLKADPMICNRYASPIHKNGRGAGGGCFIKDIAALREFYEKVLPKDLRGLSVFKAVEAKNRELLVSSGKDEKLLQGVYGDAVHK